MIYIDQQLHWMRILQEWRAPFLDAFFRFLNFFDSEYFAVVLLSFIWIGCSWRWGARIAYLMIGNGFAIGLAKMLCNAPRPFVFDPSLKMVKAVGFGFPSGGAETSFLLGSILIYYWKSPWSYPLALPYLLLVSFSRVYLGVHFPLDVVGGWVLGFVVFRLFVALLDPVEKVCARAPTAALCASLLSGLALPGVGDKERALLASLLATSVGLYLSRRYALYFSPPRQKIWCALLGLFAVATSLSGGIALQFLPLSYSDRVLYQVIFAAVWVSLVASPLCKKWFRLSDAE